MRPPFDIRALALLAALAGCADRAAEKSDALAWAAEPPAPPTEGAIYQAGREIVLAANPVAHHVGDIVTIVLNEQTAAQKSATTSTSKATTVNMPSPTIFGAPVTIHGTPILENNINNATKFAGQGASAESNSLTGYLTATVLKVLPNGNLFIAGEKQIGLNQGREFVRVTGVIRPIDLASDDSIPSYRVASAHITYSGKGAIADANAQSWLARFFNSPWMPF
ncbi:MAG TPA: flagellar basal body L-ring protein FlgH [Steroidobacteraceae bacterium]|nr:flagellar basal body L-ring protein FlgH [Steroidobacteraceae bacterium]